MFLELVLCCSLHPTQPFFYITESGFSHLKRRLLHFHACLSEAAEVVQALAFSCCATEKRGGQKGRKEGRRLEACRGVEPESRNELLCLYLNMKERGLLCLSDSKTKGCYLHGACLTLDYSEGEVTTVSFPSSLCSSLYRFFIPNSL